MHVCIEFTHSKYLYTRSYKHTPAHTHLLKQGLSLHQILNNTFQVSSRRLPKRNTHTHTCTHTYAHTYTSTHTHLLKQGLRMHQIPRNTFHFCSRRLPKRSTGASPYRRMRSWRDNLTIILTIILTRCCRLWRNHFVTDGMFAD